MADTERLKPPHRRVCRKPVLPWSGGLTRGVRNLRKTKRTRRRQAAWVVLDGGCAMLIMLVAATGLFGLAHFLDEADWAVAVCTGSESFCQHPEWTGVGAIAMFGVYLAVRGME